VAWTDWALARKKGMAKNVSRTIPTILLCKVYGTLLIVIEKLYSEFW
jgi:hypothetical protein